MQKSYRIFQYVSIDGEIHLRDAYLLNVDIFKYQGCKGEFKTYKDAQDWLAGLSTLEGEFVIVEVFVKSK